jgi:hypothetical protein
MGNTMSISEYELFGVSHHANETNTYTAVSKGISGMAEKNETTTTTQEKRFASMAKETEVKAATFCVLAFVLGLCCALMLGCKTSAKVEGGAEIIELKPLKMQELTYPVHDYSKICADCGFGEWTDSWCEAHIGETAFCSASK